MLQPFISWRDNVTTFSVGGITLQHFELAQKSRDKSKRYSRQRGSIRRYMMKTILKRQKFKEQEGIGLLQQMIKVIVNSTK